MAKKKQQRDSHQELLDNQPLAVNDSPTKHLRARLFTPILALVATLLFVVIYLARMDRLVGMFQDDAWYVLLGKALATGHGYTLINSPTGGILPLYPPAFPFLISLAFRILPQFPENLWLIKSLSVAAMFLTGLACYRFFTRYRSMPGTLSLALSSCVALAPGLVFIATSSVMSECIFAMVQMLVLIAVERCAEARDKGAFWIFALLAAAVSSWAFLTRSIAVTLIIATLIYLAKERLFKSALVFLLGVGLLAGSWTIFSRMHAPTAEQRAEVNTYVVRPYTEQFWDRVAGLKSAGEISLGELPERLWNNSLSIISSDLGGIVMPIFFPALNQGLAERGTVAQLLVSLLITGLIIAGFVSVAREKTTVVEFSLVLSVLIVIIWPFPPYRFLLPSLPLFLFYFQRGVKLLMDLHQQYSEVKHKYDPYLGLTGASLLIFVLSLIGNANYIQRKNAEDESQHPKWIRVFNENEAIMKWVAENLPQSEAVVSANPALVHLYTGHKTISFEGPVENWARWKRLGVRYLVHISPTRLPEPDPVEAKFRIMYRANKNLNLRVTDLGPPAIRQDWKLEPPRSMRAD